MLSMVDFNYSHFKGLLDGGDSSYAMAYYKHHFNGQNIHSTRGQRLDIIGKMEQDYGFLGVRVNPKRFDDRILTEDVVDHVAAVICRSVMIKREMGSRHSTTAD